MAVTLLLSVTACTKEDVTPYDPEGTAGLNMMFESYGGTLLDGTDIYIDDAQNFVSGYFRMAYMGPVAGLSSMNRHLLNNLTGSAAVEVGGGYMIYAAHVLFGGYGHRVRLDIPPHEGGIDDNIHRRAD